MPRPDSLQPEQYYHIYNRGNSGEPLFREARNYGYFLKLYAKYIEPIAETYAYCLLSNHFHFLVRIKDWQSFPPSRAFANLFSTYTKAFNKAYQRTGSLFEKPFRRRRVDSDRYFTALVAYIHRNPQKTWLRRRFSPVALLLLPRGPIEPGNSHPTRGGARLVWRSGRVPGGARGIDGRDDHRTFCHRGQALSREGGRA